MSRLSQSKLQRDVETLIKNGKLPQAQAVIAGIGYGPAALEAGEIMLRSWHICKMQARALLVAQKKATRDEHEAREAAHQEVNNFSAAVRVLFDDNEVLLATLGVLAQQEEDGGANGHGATSQATRISKSATELIARWRLLFANTQTLSRQQKVRLVNAGWHDERLISAAALVESFAAAHATQQQQTRAYWAELAVAKEAEIALRKWYWQAIRRSKLAIQQANPSNRDQLHQLLGL